MAVNAASTAARGIEDNDRMVDCKNVVGGNEICELTSVPVVANDSAG